MIHDPCSPGETRFFEGVGRFVSGLCIPFVNVLAAFRMPLEFQVGYILGFTLLIGILSLLAAGVRLLLR